MPDTSTAIAIPEAEIEISAIRAQGARDQRISREGVLVIKSQQHRSLERNREEALARLHELVARAAVVPRQRRPTRPTRSSQRKRLEGKTLRGRVRSSAD